MVETELLRNPPVVQMMLTVQFRPPVDSLTMIDVASIFDELKSRYPVFQQVGIAGRMEIEIQPRKLDGAAVESSALPRAMMSTQDLEFSVLLQTDRFSFAWMRQTPLALPASYPGFSMMAQRFTEELNLIRKWFNNKGFPDFTPSIVELAYFNAFSLGTEDNRRPVSEIVTFFQNPRKAAMTGLSVDWVELLRPDEPLQKDLSGTVEVQATPGLAPDGEQVLLFNMTARSMVPNDPWSNLNVYFIELHDKVVEIFQGSVQPRALEVGK